LVRRPAPSLFYEPADVIVVDVGGDCTNAVAVEIMISYSLRITHIRERAIMRLSLEPMRSESAVSKLGIDRRD
jgi:hypothetical protein